MNRRKRSIPIPNDRNANPPATASEPPPLRCSRCGASLTLGRGECYLADVRAVADPTPPVFTGEDLSKDAAREIDRLLTRLRGLSERQLVGQVYRRALYCLCNACYSQWAGDPFGTAEGGRST